MKLTTAYSPIHAILGLWFAVTSMVVVSGEEALYAPDAPEGSAFIRFYNGAAGDGQASVGKLVFETGITHHTTEYQYLPAGSYTVVSAEQRLPVALKPKHCYTIARTPEGLKLIDEPLFSNRKKALLSVQNLSSETLSVRTADGKVDVFPSVPVSGRLDREVNPVKITLALYQGDQKLQEIKPVVLERSHVFSLFISGDRSRLTTVWAKGEVAE